MFEMFEINCFVQRIAIRLLLEACCAHFIWTIFEVAKNVFEKSSKKFEIFDASNVLEHDKTLFEDCTKRFLWLF